MSPKKVLIDTDCGVDDAIAIMIALASPAEVSVLGITTVSGNVPLANVMDNVLRLLSFLGRTEIPVFRGASRPLVEPLHHAPDVHGANGLGGVELPAPRIVEQRERAPEGIARIASENLGLTLLTLGPLTNIAIALNLYPELKGQIAEIVAMGGAVEKGNVTRFAEFNFHADPEAVQSVLDSGIPLSLLTWDTTLTVAHTEAELEALGLKKTASGKLVLDLQQTVFRFIEKSARCASHHAARSSGCGMAGGSEDRGAAPGHGDAHGAGPERHARGVHHPTGRRRSPHCRH